MVSRVSQNLKIFYYSNVFEFKKGTGALKSDFTRLGKRTFYGLLRDGYNSMIRYFLNNFYDGFRQDAIDLILGNYQIKMNEGAFSNNSPLLLQSNREKALKVVIIILFISFAILYLILVTPTLEFKQKIIYLIIWLLVMFYFIKSILKKGKYFVNQPKLFKKY